jgi:hypothetical protein
MDFTPPSATVLLPQPVCGTLVDRDGDGRKVADIFWCEPGPGLTLDPGEADCNDFDAALSNAVGYGLDNDADGYGGYVLETRTAMVMARLRVAGFACPRRSLLSARRPCSCRRMNRLGYGGGVVCELVV